MFVAFCPYPPAYMDGHKRLGAAKFDGGTTQHPAPSSGFIALYLALQLCRRTAAYGMSLEASREGDEMRAPYHYFHNYVDSVRGRARLSFCCFWGGGGVDESVIWGRGLVSAAAVCESEKHMKNRSPPQTSPSLDPGLGNSASRTNDDAGSVHLPRPPNPLWNGTIISSVLKKKFLNAHRLCEGMKKLNPYDLERLRAHPHHAFNLEGDLLRQWDATGVLKLCDSGRGDSGRGEGRSCGVHA